MDKLKVIIYGREYNLASTLRVAYKVQGQNGHKPYSEVFEQIGNMTIEKQIQILYAAFEVANPMATNEITQIKFLDWYLDNYNLTQVMDQLKAVISGIMGKDFDEDKGKPDGEQSEGN